MRTSRRGAKRRQLRIHCLSPANILQFRAQLAVGGFAQVFELLGLELAHLAWFDIEHERAIAHAPDLLDMMANLFKHLAQLAVATLDDDDFVPGIVALADLANLRRRSLYSAGARFSALDGDAGAQSIEGLLARFAAHFDEISLFHASRSARKFVGQVAVVGHDQEALAEVVEPADGIEALA